MGENIPIEKRWTTDGFMQRYEEICKEVDTYFEAYKRAELEHVHLFGTRRYSSYDSFRMTRKGLLNK